jgi:membrane protein required for colicin V production
MRLPSRDFESRASASSATPAQIPNTMYFYLYTREGGNPSPCPGPLSEIPGDGFGGPPGRAPHVSTRDVFRYSGGVNLLDVIIAVLCLGLAIHGIFQGMVRQLFSWGGLIAGHIAGVKFYGIAQERLRLGFSHGDIVAYLLTFVAVYLAVRLVGLLVERWVRGSALSGTDRFAGLLAGFGKGILLSVLLVFVLVILLPRDTSLLRESKLTPKAVVAARWMQKVFPERIRDSFREKIGDLSPPHGGKTEDPAPLQPKNRSRK